jgi:hypothetical protein
LVAGLREMAAIDLHQCYAFQIKLTRSKESP